jgi:hypothetical protein
MLNYVKKFAVDIFPSVAATVIGAYIVNHYIVSKPGANAPVAAAVSAADPKGEGKAEAKSEAKTAPDAKPAADVSNLPAAGVKARGISEKTIMEKTAAERPAVVEKAQEKTEAKTEAKTDTKTGAKADTKAEAKADTKAEAKADTKADTKADVKDAKADSKADTKSAETTPAEPRRHQVAPREKEKIRVVLPSPVQPAPSAAAPAPVAAAPNPAVPVETAVAPDERRDANDLARAAIERLRVNGESSPRAPDMARIPDAPKIDAPRGATTPALRSLPPPVMVSAPPTGEPYGQASQQARPPYAATAEVSDPSRPTPPAEIPVSRPLDLRADVAEPSVRERTTAAAEEVLSTAKSIFHAVLPK